jgi:Anti-sigma factor NepR
MTRNSGSAEQAGERQADGGHESRSLAGGQEPAVRAAQPGHLFIVRNLEAQQNPSSTRKASPVRYQQQKGLLDRSVQAQIGRLLRDVFAGVADEPVPERFLKLLEALETKEKQA